MFIVDYLGNYFRNLSVEVDIDPLLLPSLVCADKTTRVRTVPINVTQLIYSIGLIQTRRSSPSNRQKFTDKSDLIEYIVNNTNEFRVKITDVQNNGFPEVLKSISEDFGVGISVLVSTQLFGINKSTIQRVAGTKKRPDWNAQTLANQTISVESKGSSSQQTTNRQEADAIAQKNASVANIRIASMTLIRENAMTKTKLVDPPPDDDNMDPVIRRQLLRAGHYASAFSFLGHAILSRYFSRMRKRISNNLGPDERELKERTFIRLRDRYPHIQYKGREFTGTFYNISENDYLFIGVDMNLIFYQGFVDFVDYEQDEDETLQANHYHLFTDGILIMEIKNIAPFTNNVNITGIKNYQENNTISDIDEMNQVSFRKYIIYILQRIGFEILNSNNEGLASSDFIVRLGQKEYVFEIRLRGEHRTRLTDDFLYTLQNRFRGRTVILVTNSNRSYQGLDLRNLRVIGRNELKAITTNYRALLNFIG